MAKKEKLLIPEVNPESCLSVCHCLPFQVPWVAPSWVGSSSAGTVSTSDHIIVSWVSSTCRWIHPQTSQELNELLRAPDLEDVGPSSQPLEPELGPCLPPPSLPLQRRLASSLHPTAGPEAVEAVSHGLKPLSQEQKYPFTPLGYFPRRFLSS